MRRVKKKSTPENAVVSACLYELLTHRNAFAWRQNTGGAYYGEGQNKSFVRFGIPGCSDIIGCIPIVITQEMVGKTIGQFIANECKAEKGKLTDKQIGFLEDVDRAGGLAIAAWSGEDLMQKLDKMLAEQASPKTDKLAPC